VSGVDAGRLARLPLLAALSPATRRAVAAGAETLHLAAGEALFRSGDAYRQAVFLLYEGRLRMARADGAVETLSPGAVIGLSNYLDQAPYTATVTAEAPAVLLVLPEASLRALETAHPDLYEAFNRLLAERLQRRARLRHPVTGRLAQPVARAMKSPVVTCDAGTPLRAALERMLERRIGSLAALDDRGRPVGLLTCAGLARAVILDGGRPTDSIMTAACEKPVQIPPDLPLWQAEEVMQREGAKYLLVAEGDRLLGVLSQSDILRSALGRHTPLSGALREAGDIPALARLRRALPEAAREAREGHRRASAAVRELSEIHLALQRRCVSLTLEALRAEGRGPPPCGFAVLVMGSGGRHEMLLAPDQDNGLILDDREAEVDAAALAWFETFASRLNDHLAALGYPLCPGEVMARNPLYRKPLSRWRAQVDRLLEHPSGRAGRWSNIVFDFATLYGDDRLTQALRRHLLDGLQQRPALLEFMAAQDAEGRPAIGPFNILLTSDRPEGQGRIDLKRNGLRIISDAARILALGAGIGATHSLDRIDALARHDAISPQLAASARAAFEELLDLLLDHQIAQAERGQAPDGLVDPGRLPAEVKATLRVALRAAKRFQDLLQGRYGRTPF